MEVRIVALQASAGGDCITLATGVASTPTAAVFTVDDALVTPSVDTFMRKGAAPIALADGTDQLLKANTPYRVNGIKGVKLAFILASSTGSVHIAPGA